LLALSVHVLPACADDEVSVTGAVATAKATTSARPGSPLLLPAARQLDPNPLGLSAVAALPPEGARVYAPPPRVLAGLHEGATLALRRSRVVGHDGEVLIVRQGWGAPYAVHPGLVIAPQSDKLRRGQFVLAPYQGQLRHAVLVTLLHRDALIRFTDVGHKLRKQRVSPDLLGRIDPGLSPGAYAAYRSSEGAEWQHVMLVSPSVRASGRVGWLALGYAAEVRIIDEADLVPMPRSFRPKVKRGDTLWVAWRGTLVPATVRKVTSQHLFTLRRPRLSRPIIAGIGMVMLPR